MSVYMCQTVCFKYVIYFMPIIAQLRVNFSPLTFKNGNMCTFFFWLFQAVCGILVPCVCVTSVMSDPMDWSPPGSSAHGILQARILEQVAMPTSRGSSQPRDQTSIWLHLLHCRWISLPTEPPGKPLVPCPEVKRMSPAPSVTTRLPGKYLYCFDQLHLYDNCNNRKISA